MLVDHVQELEPAAVGRGIELKIHGPDLVGMFGPMSSHRAVGGPWQLALPVSGPLQAFLPPEPLHPFVVYRLGLPPQQTVGHAAAPADVLSGDPAETISELRLLQVDDLVAVALGTAVLARHPADLALGCPEALLQDNDSPAATLRA